MSGRISIAARGAGFAVVATRLAGAARPRPPVEAAAADGVPPISVVIPARDEELRLPPLLTALSRAPAVIEVVVVDDESSDATATIAAAAGATVLAGRPRPSGWAGKPWALQQGIEAARGEWVVMLDADTRPGPSLPAAVVARAVADGTELLTVAGRFDCPTPAATWLHASMLATLVYRFGPPGTRRRPVWRRAMANGQCMAARRSALLAAGGFGPVAGELVEDVALARSLARRGGAVDFLDASDLLTVRMYESFGDTWRGWGRSLALPNVEPRSRQVVDLAVLAVAMPGPWLRLLARRFDLVDAALVALRLGTLAGTRLAYAGGRAAWSFWASPLADALAVGVLAAGMQRRARIWRGRRYVV